MKGPKMTGEQGKPARVETEGAAAENSVSCSHNPCFSSQSSAEENESEPPRKTFGLVK